MIHTRKPTVNKSMLVSIKTIISCLAVAALLLTTGCTGVNVKDYQNKEPRFIIENYFDGQTIAKGVFQDRFGKIRRMFTVTIDGTWDEDTQTLTLDEDFVYSDGETENRVWKIKKIDDHTYQGTAGGVVGTANGSSYGNALNWNYRFDLPVDGKTWRVHFKDWLYMIDDTTVFNKAVVSKFGFTLGEVYITFEKKS